MKKHKLKLIALLVLLFSVGMMSIAYLTSPTDTIENIFTLAKLDDPDIDEPNFPDEPPDILPGTIIPKDPTITLKGFTTNTYIYMAVKSKLVYEDENGELVDAATYYHGSTYTTPAPGDIVDPGIEGFSPDWIHIKTSVDKMAGHIIYIYRFKYAVETYNAQYVVSPILFSAVGFDENLTATIIDSIDMENDAQSIDIKGFLHQVVDGMDVSEIDDEVIDFFMTPLNW